MPLSAYSPIRDNNAVITPGDITVDSPKLQQLVNSIRQLMADMVGGQLPFPAVQIPSADPNTLDDYEENVWTPSYIPTTGAFGSITYDASNRYGLYTKIGRQVTCQFRIRTTAMTVGTASGQLQIGGLPFPSFNNAATGHPGQCSFAYSAGWTTLWPHGGLIVFNTSLIDIYSKASMAADSGLLSVGNMVTGVGNDIIGQATYFTAS